MNWVRPSLPLTLFIKNVHFPSRLGGNFSNVNKTGSFSKLALCACPKRNTEILALKWKGMFVAMLQTNGCNLSR